MNEENVWRQFRSGTALNLMAPSFRLTGNRSRSRERDRSNPARARWICLLFIENFKNLPNFSVRNIKENVIKYSKTKNDIHLTNTHLINFLFSKQIRSKLIRDPALESASRSMHEPKISAASFSKSSVCNQFNSN